MPKKPLRKPSDAPKTRERAKLAPSWWVAHAAPTSRASFADAARLRNLEMQSNPEWQRPEKLSQIGQL
jgi:hypothetical protein